jgi:hypothetical protein
MYTMQAGKDIPCKQGCNRFRLGRSLEWLIRSLDSRKGSLNDGGVDVERKVRVLMDFSITVYWRLSTWNAVVFPVSALPHMQVGSV